MSCKYMRNTLDVLHKDLERKQTALDKEMKLCFEEFMENVFPHHSSEIDVSQFSYYDMLRAYRNGWATGTFQERRALNEIPDNG